MISVNTKVDKHVGLLRRALPSNITFIFSMPPELIAKGILIPDINIS